MTGYLFYPTADATQDQIWLQTVARWGEEKAIAYINGLHRHLETLSTSKTLWRRLPQTIASRLHVKVVIYISRYEHHYIFFRELPSGKIGIVSLLHERMDLPVRLARDLARISATPLNEVND